MQCHLQVEPRGGSNGGGGAVGARPPLKVSTFFLLHGMQCTLDFRSAHCICTEHSVCNALRVKCPSPCLGTPRKCPELSILFLISQIFLTPRLLPPSGAGALRALPSATSWIRRWSRMMKQKIGYNVSTP